MIPANKHYLAVHDEYVSVLHVAVAVAGGSNFSASSGLPTSGVGKEEEDFKESVCLFQVAAHCPGSPGSILGAAQFAALRTS